MEKNICIQNEETKLNIVTLKSFTRARYKIHKLECEIIKEGGITVAQYDVLRVLYNEESLKVGQIMEQVLTTPGNITVVIKNLEKDALVKRYQNSNDKRSINVSITDKGIELIEKIIPNHITIINDLLEGLTKEEKIVLRELLEKINNS